MSVDDATKRELVEAKRAIIAELDDLETKWMTGAGPSGHWRLRGPQDTGDAYDQLMQELREINELLGLDSSDGL